MKTKEVKVGDLIVRDDNIGICLSYVSYNSFPYETMYALLVDWPDDDGYRVRVWQLTSSTFEVVCLT